MQTAKTVFDLLANPVRKALTEMGFSEPARRKADLILSYGKNAIRALGSERCRSRNSVENSGENASKRGRVLFGFDQGKDSVFTD